VKEMLKADPQMLIPRKLGQNASFRLSQKFIFHVVVVVVVGSLRKLNCKYAIFKSDNSFSLNEF